MCETFLLKESQRFNVHWESEFLSIIGSAEALPILCVSGSVRERERERERERYRERKRDRWKWRHHFALKLAMSLHFPLPKIRTFRFSHHTSRHHCGAEIRNEFTLSIAKKCRPLFSDSLARAVRRVIANPRQKFNDQILSSPRLFFP